MGGGDTYILVVSEMLRYQSEVVKF